MTVAARYKNGPRHGRKNNLHGNDLPPDRVPVTAKEAKAVNMAPGRYNLAGIEDGVAVYLWQSFPQEVDA